MLPSFAVYRDNLIGRLVSANAIAAELSEMSQLSGRPLIRGGGANGGGGGGRGSGRPLIGWPDSHNARGGLFQHHGTRNRALISRVG